MEGVSEKFFIFLRKRIFPCFLIVLLLVPVLLAVPVSAEITASGTVNTTVNWFIQDGILNFAGNGTITNFSSATSVPWNSHKSSITGIYIDSGISFIGSYTFNNLTLNSVYIADSVSSLGERCFGYCTADYIRVPSSVTSIPSRAFSASTINSLYLPSSITSINYMAFQSFDGTIYMESEIPPVWSSDPYTVHSIKHIVVPYGCGDAYKLAPGWIKLSSLIVEAAPSVPDFTVSQSWDSSQVYAYQEETSADVFSVSTVVSGWNPTYQWYYGSSQGGTFTAMPAETLATFTPKTTAEYLGTSVYYCAVTLSDGSTGASKTVNSGYLTVQVTEVEPPATEPGGGGGGGGGDDPGTSTPDYSEKLDDISSKLEDVSSAITDSTDQIIDTINPSTPELDDSLSGIDSDLNDVTSFEDDQIADINDNAHVITDSFVVLGNGSSLAAAFSFVSGILTGTFNELGIIQSVFILPLTIGLFLFLCSRVRGFDRPVRKDISNEYLRDSQRSMDGPADFRSSSLYDSDRDKSPL